MNEAEFRAALKSKGYAAPELVERPGGLVNDEHTHEFSAFALVVDGEITVKTRNGSTTCRAGDHFELAGGIPHHEEYGANGATFLIGRKVP